MIVLNLIFLEVQFECDFFKKKIGKNTGIPVYTGMLMTVYRYSVFAIPILFKLTVAHPFYSLG